MLNLLSTAQEWLSILPEVWCVAIDVSSMFMQVVLRSAFLLQSLAVLKRTADNLKDPLFRFFEREVSFTRCQWKLLQTLANLLFICALSCLCCPSGEVWCEAPKTCAR